MVFTEPTTVRTSDARRLRVASRRADAAPARNHRSRLRAALLTAVWMLPGVWCAAHALAHATEASHHERGLAVSTTADIPARSCDHDHAHSHPNASPVLSMEGTKKLDASMLLAAAVEIEDPKATLLSHEDTVLRRAAQLAAALSRPRAPPIS